MSLLTADDISISFGGIRAVDHLSFEIDPGDVFCVIGPNGAGKTSIFNLVSRIYPLETGRLLFQGRDLGRLAAHDIASTGIARTFQNIKLFDNASVLTNLMLGRYRHNRAGLLEQCLFLPGARRQVLADREKVEQVIDFLDIERYRDKPAGDLSYGVRKIVELGRALDDRVLAVNLGARLALGSATDVQADPAVVAAYLGGSPGDPLSSH